jgi:hypothetical protein
MSDVQRLIPLSIAQHISPFFGAGMKLREDLNGMSEGMEKITQCRGL